MLLGTIAVAVTFVSGYLNFSAPNSNLGQSSQSGNKTNAGGAQVYAKAFLRANVTGYAKTLSISVNCGNDTNKTIAEASNVLQNLENNNSVATFITESNSKLFVESGNMSSYQIYAFVNAHINRPDCVSYSTSALIGLPATIKFNILSANQSITVNIPSSKRVYSIPETLSANAVVSVNVTVAALIYANGTINGNLSITR